MLTRNRPDEGLVRDVLAGRKERFGVLVERYQNLVYATVLARAGAVYEAEDLAQSAFVKAFANLNALEEPAKFGSWLRRIAANEADSFLRRRQVRERTTERMREALAPPVEAPDAGLLRDEAHEGLWAAVAELPEAQREVVLLFYTEQRSQEEVAAYLSINLSAVKSRLRRAKEQLRDRLLERQLRKGLAERTVEKDFKKRVMGALPLTPWTQTQMPWAWSRLGWIGAVAALGALAGGLLVHRTLPPETSAARIHVRLDAPAAPPAPRRPTYGSRSPGFDEARGAALAGEAVRRGWGGRLTWDFDAGDGGWRARVPPVGPTEPVALPTRVSDGCLEIVLGGAEGTSAVEVVSPRMAYDSGLFDRARVRLRIQGGRPGAGWVGVSWTNELNRLFPGADPEARRRPWTAPVASEPTGSRFGVVRDLQLGQGWQTVEVTGLDRVDPMGWAGQLLDLRLALGLALGLDEAQTGADGGRGDGAPVVLQIDRIVLGAGPQRRLQELPVPTPPGAAPAGTWLQPGPVAGLPQPGVRRLLLGDLDGDGDADLVAGFDATDARWDRHKGWMTARNDGSGRFTAGRTHTLEYRRDGYSSVVALWLADVDVDGTVDVVARVGTRTLLYANRGDGRQWRETTWAGRAAVGVGDADGDGAVDVALAGAPAAPRTPQEVWLRRNDGHGGFVELDIGGRAPGWSAVDLQDLDGDATAEMVWQRPSPDGARLTVRVDRGWRDGGWAQTQEIEVEVASAARDYGLPAWSGLVADLDGDGWWEVGVPSGVYADAGVFTTGMELATAAGRRRPWLPASVHLWRDAHDLAPPIVPQRWDLNGDGWRDAVFASHDLHTGPQVILMQGQAHDLPVEEGAYPLSGAPRGWTVGDVDGDGCADVVVAQVAASGSGVRVLRNVTGPPVWTVAEGRAPRSQPGRE